MRGILCTQGYMALVDDEDWPNVVLHKWYAHNSGVNTKRPARRTAGGRKVIFLAHQILPVKAGFVVDHINGNPFDNRRCNLRYCTNAENLRNRGKSRNSSLPYKGVSRATCGDAYFARICADGKRHHLGTFSCLEQAARAYDKAALELHGEFARLNFPQMNPQPIEPLAANWRPGDVAQTKSPGRFLPLAQET